MNEEGFVRRMVPMPEGLPGPVWTDAVFAVRDGSRERLLAHFSRMKDLGTRLERGIMVFNDEAAAFEKVVEVPLDHPLGPEGQAVSQKLLVDGVEYQLFCHWGPPNIRVPAEYARAIDLDSYEAYTPLVPGGRFAGTQTQLDRREGKLIWAWKKNTATLSNRQQKELLDAGLMSEEESPQLLRNIEDGKPIVVHSASAAYNEFRGKWIMIALEIDGTSKLGEVWYSEAPAPEGPWRWARKIVTHNRYSFYNPRMHAFFNQDGGRLVYFEGTFANSLSGTEVATPRYEYNQVMYRLDLADPRLRPLWDR
ncbi:MAG: DUF4185 domain-containing protein, partial [Phycisphaerae bacterium]|nr:DUF4185 domain-containing protein [Phycisphaerae bacterium]MDW8262363.1 hypothetical protein [Phycisphaerales bacterium]